MRYLMVAIAALIITCLSINALSQQSDAEKYLNDSLKELSDYDSDDPLGAATPHEARAANEDVQMTNNTTMVNTTAVQGAFASNATSEVSPGNSSNEALKEVNLSKLQNASSEPPVAPAVSLVDNYLN
ncbi:MAG TPA: hypothetical protein VN455_09375, partial [Methanotrichaceae archaeon]|nr:hypothetical protein [Methanotrichaceae archaeon]